MKIKKLLSDWMLVAEEPARERTSLGLHIPNPNKEPLRIGKVLMAGPGRKYRDKTIPMIPEIVGRRVGYLAGASDTLQGQQLKKLLPDGQRFIRLGDVLVLVDGDVELSK